MGRTRKERTVRTHSFTILLKHCFSDHPLTYMGRTRKECTVRTHSFTSLLKHYFGDTYNYYTTVIEHRGSTSDRNRSQNIPDKTFLENHISDRDMIKLWGTMQHTHHNIGWVLDKMLLVHKYRKRRRQDPFWHNAIKKDEHRNISNSYSFKLSSLCTFYYTEWSRSCLKKTKNTFVCIDIHHWMSQITII